jgi:hypothetical protein
MKTQTKLEIASSAFAGGSEIPRRHSGEGEDLSPPLSWGKLPVGTREIALICDDPDAPRPEPWVHWVIYNIPADATGLEEGIPAGALVAKPAGAIQGVNTSGKQGYNGPMPPRGHGVHHYHFKLYALDAALDLNPGLSKVDLLAAMKGHVLDEGELVGTYQR